MIADTMNKELDDINKKIDLILMKINNLEKEEKAVEKEEKEILKDEDKLLKDEKNIKGHFKKRVMKHLEFRDLNKGLIGSFVGSVGHFAFFEGRHIAEQMSMARATLLFVTSYLVGVIFIYFSGFRKVKEDRFVHMIPVRVTVMFVISIFSSLVILFLFEQISFSTPFDLIYKTVANVTMLAMFGATTADFVGD